jgi:Na+:H+ antiporter, NhaA family
VTTGPPPLSHSWLASDRPVARLVARPMRRFLDTEAAGGVILLVFAVFALVWVNSPLGSSYSRLWSTDLGIEVGRFRLSGDLRHWINDGLMTIFFFVVSLEIKRELVEGELSGLRRATLPIIAALGGMIVPALIYVALNAGGKSIAGWGIPMATDIAFAVGVLALVGKGAPPGLKVLLLSIAIADDIGAILVIALFYTDQIQVGWLVVAGSMLVVIAGMRRVHIWWTPIYIVAGLGLWLATFQSGVHATIAGVALAFLTPALPEDPEGVRDAMVELDQLIHDPDPATIRRTTIQAQELVSVAERLEHALHPWSSFLIVPIFALANAGVRVSADALSDSVSSSVVLGIALGLVVGKLLGISAAAWVAVRLRISELPNNLAWADVVGCGAVAGIGFTVALFISGLAFGEGETADEAKIGILAGSIVAACLAAALLRLGKR